MSPPIRSALFVPATRTDRFERAAGSGAHAVILDLEDAVAPGDKVQARVNLSGVTLSVPMILRINAPGTPWHEDDLAAARALRPAAVLLPKAEPGAAMRDVIKTLDSIPVMALVETAYGLAEVRSIAATPGITRLAFGSIDYCADLGCDHVPEVLMPARLALVVASRLAELPPPLDGVTTDTRDPDLAGTDARHARAIGMGGKLLIHPAQVPPVNRAFAPTQAEIDAARRILATPDGVALVDGAMVDAPVRARARQVLALAGFPIPDTEREFR
jgi:citrate lyase subunit beta / citryl-CoA lyase